MSAKDKQISGEHYRSLKIQPVDYIEENKLTFSEGAVVKYITRHRFKNGAEDIRKAIHFCQLILERDYGFKD